MAICQATYADLPLITVLLDDDGVDLVVES
jgi:hypothetical protein